MIALAALSLDGMGLHGIRFDRVRLRLQGYQIQPCFGGPYSHAPHFLRAEHERDTVYEFLPLLSGSRVFLPKAE
jgi:hypothetical protein